MGSLKIPSHWSVPWCKTHMHRRMRTHTHTCTHTRMHARNKHTHTHTYIHTHIHSTRHTHRHSWSHLDECNLQVYLRVSYQIECINSLMQRRLVMHSNLWEGLLWVSVCLHANACACMYGRPQKPTPDTQTPTVRTDKHYVHTHKPNEVWFSVLSLRNANWHFIQKCRNTHDEENEPDCSCMIH